MRLVWKVETGCRFESDEVYVPLLSPTPNLQYLKGFTERTQSWSSFSELETFFAYTGAYNSVGSKRGAQPGVFVCFLLLGLSLKFPLLSGYIKTNWKEDWYFGYQCLNGSNPLLIRQIHQIPPKLAVTCEMLRPFLPKGSSLNDELKVNSQFSDLQVFWALICVFLSHDVTERKSLPVGLLSAGQTTS